LADLVATTNAKPIGAASNVYTDIEKLLHSLDRSDPNVQTQMPLTIRDWLDGFLVFLVGFEESCQVVDSRYKEYVGQGS